MAFIYDLTDTWNAGGTTFNAIKMNVTDTASAAASKLVTLQVGGSERFGVDKTGIASFAGVVRGPAGTTSAPAFSVTSDTNTGMWFPAADTIAFSEGGVEAMRLDSAGRVAIGTTTPNAAAQLEVASTTRAFLPPRMTTAQRDAIASPPDGSVLYNSTIGALEVRQGGAWVNPTTAGQVNTPPSLETDFQNEFYTSRRTARTFSQLINFTRTTAATFVGSNGLIQTTPQSRNLFTFTEEFDNAAWTKSNVTITANSTTAPDGTMTADTATATASASVALNQSAVVSATAATFSIYAKQGNSATAANTFRLRNTTTATTLVEITLNYSTGAIAYTVGSTGASAVNVGNGWWRIAITATSGITSGNTLRVDAGFAGTGATNDFCFLWGAQLEAGSTATDYTRNFGGLFPPRFDYDPVTLAPRGLLIEEQRTNLVLRSEEFNNVYWTPTGGTVTANATTSPDGTANADNLVEDTSTGFHRVFASSACAANTTYTFTAYVKAAGRTQVRLLETTVLGAVFDLASGTVASTDAGVTASIQNAGNGWYRCRITNTTGGAQTTYVAQIQAISAGNITYTGNGTAALSLYGAQLEAGAFATSYIPTVASQVTRTADIATIAAPNFASWYNQTEGTLVAGFDSANPSSRYAVSATDGTSNNFIAIDFSSGGQIRGRVTTGGVSQASLGAGAAVAANAVINAGIAYRENSVIAAVAGTLSSEDTSVTLPAVNQLSLGALNAALLLNGHIRSIRYYPVRLSNTQLQALTA